MPRLVLLSEGFTGRTYDLKVEKTSVGRTDENAFTIDEPSVSSQHAEIILRGNDVVIKDLNSTNGTFINGDPITEAVLKPGQILQFGMVELRLDTGESSPGAPTTPAAKKSQLDHTMIVKQGVKLGQGDVGNKPINQGTEVFKKKSNRSNKIFWAVIIVAIAALLGILGWALTKM
ncbi:MAG: FHA domain-containing protein [Verrucomicrobia bacterium]|nr:FHA domain-containing protein [Verrucomicrobiota bacterium]